MLKHAGRYEIIAELGRGGFGSVYKAFDPTVGRMVAVKTLIIEQDQGMLVRFRNEAAASGRLRHPNIVTIYDFGEQDGVPFIVMELLEGEDLQSVISKKKPIALLEKIQIMRQVAEGLRHAHLEGIIHRDIKPANIMLLANGTAKIMDFGIALISHATQQRLTPRGAMIGTFRYMAPEQFLGAQPDQRSDIFAYGVLFYELLTGLHPFDASEPAAWMFNILHQEPVPVDQLCAGCPEQLASTVARLLQKDREQRYQNLEDVLFDTEPPLAALKRTRIESLFEQAKAAREEKRLDPAQRLIRQILEIDATYAPARELREDVQKALRQQALRPKIDALVRNAQEAIATRHLSEAVEKLESAVRLDPTDQQVQSELQHAKAALDLENRVSRELATANEALAAGDFAAAQRVAREVLRLAPGELRAQELLDHAIRKEAEQQQREARLAATIDRTRRFIEIKSWREAADLIKRLQNEFPEAGEIPALIADLRAGFNAERREQHLASQLASAREEMHAGDLAAAVRRLEAVIAEYPEAAEAPRMLETLKVELEERKRRETVGRCLEDARKLLSSQKFSDAARVLEAGLSSYPDDLELQAQLRFARGSAERQAGLAEALSVARRRRSQAKFDEALTALNVFTVAYGPDPEVDELRQSIEQERESARRAAEVRALAARAREILAQDRPAEAVELLRAANLAAEPDIARILEDAQARLANAERAEALKKALASAEGCRQELSDEAIRILDEFAGRYGADARVDQLREKIRRESAQFAAALRDLLSRASALLAQNNATEAARLIQAAPQNLRAHPQVELLLDSARIEVRRKAEAEAARELALRAALDSAQQQRGAGEFDRAIQILDAFTLQHGAVEPAEALRRQIQGERRAASRAAQVRDLSGRARDLLTAGKAEEAARLLGEAPVEIRPDLADVAAEAEKTLREQRARREADAVAGEVRSMLGRGAIEEAWSRIEQGIRQYPGDPALVAAQADALAAQQAAQRRKSLHRAIDQINSLIEAREFDRAVQALTAALVQFPHEPTLEGVRTRIESSRAQWIESEKDREIRETRHRAESLLAFRPGEAVALLEGLSERFPEKRDALAAALIAAREALSRQLQAEQQAAERAAKVRDLTARGREFLSAGKADEAARLLDQAPPETRADLAALAAEVAREQRLRRESDALAAREAAGRRKSLEEAIAQINSLADAKDFDRAMQTLDAALAKLPLESALADLRPRIESSRAQWIGQKKDREIQETCARARGLMASRPGDAVALLERISEQFPEKNESVTTLLAEAREALRRMDVQAIIHEVEQLCERKKFREAFAKLEAAGRDDPELLSARQLIETRRQAEAGRTIADAIRSAERVGARRPRQALALLEELQDKFPSQPELVRAIEIYRESVRNAPAPAPSVFSPKVIGTIAAVVVVIAGAIWMMMRPAPHPIPQPSATSSPEPPPTSIPAENPGAGGANPTRPAAPPSGPPPAATERKTLPPYKERPKSARSEQPAPAPSEPSPSVSQPKTTETSGQVSPSVLPPAPRPSTPPIAQPSTPVVVPSPSPAVPTKSPEAATPTVPAPKNPEPPSTLSNPNAASQSDAAVINRVLAQFAGAFSDKNYKEVIRIWPSLPPQSRQGIQRDFSDERATFRYVLQPLSPPVIQGDQATVRVHRESSMTRLGKTTAQPAANVTVLLAKKGGEWHIEKMTN